MTTKNQYYYEFRELFLSVVRHAAKPNMSNSWTKKHDKQLKEYYERKIREGKNGMSVMNALRCKIISRVFAAIKRETPYVDFLKYST